MKRQRRPLNRLVVHTVLATCAALAALGALVFWVVLKSGWYHVGATRSHFQLVHTTLEKGMHASVRRHADGIVAPPALSASAGALKLQRGGALFRQHCEICHGGPGVAQAPFGQSMQPVPGPLADAARRWQPTQLYWIIRHGIKMSGMPAWELHLDDADLWALTAFVEHLPTLTAHAYRAIPRTADDGPLATREAARPADRLLGREALARFGCQGCHIIPGVTGPRVYVGTDLTGFARRPQFAGALPNTDANLVRWIRAPQTIDPQTAMPALGVGERDAADMAAYLRSLR